MQSANDKMHLEIYMNGKNEQLALANQFAKESLKYECRYRSGGPERFTTNKNTQSMIHKVSDTN